MSQTELPIESLPAWSLLNGIAFHHVGISKVEGRGLGLVAQEDLLRQADEGESSCILSVPHELVLNAEAVEQHAKEDMRFKQLLDAAGHQSPRGDVLLFLLAQIVIFWRSDQISGVSTPWTEYIRYLPKAVPLPTLWSEEEQRLLKGTSLDAAVKAKLLSLEREFDALRDKSSALPSWNEVLWENQTVTIRDWTLLDAWYRSRCMELPRGGSSMVPCIDMVNHFAKPNAAYTQNSEGGVDLCLRPGVDPRRGDEITISYGEKKAAAEMLFSYGFVDPAAVSEKMVLPFETAHDDPLAQAKLHLFGEPAIINITKSEGGSIQWDCPFAYLLGLNEEDGLAIRLLQLTDGGRQIRLLWQNEDATEFVGSLEKITHDHPNSKIFRLRTVVIVNDCLQAQLGRISSVDPANLVEDAQGAGAIRPGCREASSWLRETETRLMQATVESLDLEKSQLLADETVLGYLGSMEDTQNDLASDGEANGEHDFS